MTKIKPRIIECVSARIIEADEEGTWVTVNGVHILIKDGETAADAFKRVTGKDISKSDSVHVSKGKNGKPDLSDAPSATQDVVNLQQGKADKATIRKAVKIAKDTGGTVPYSLGDLMDAGVSIDTMRKVYRKGSG